MADHASTSLLPGLTQARVKAIAALAVNLVATASAGLSLAGLNPLPFTSDDVSAGVFAVITVISAVYNWWTHLTMTEAGYQGAQLTTALKNGTVATLQGTDAPTDTAAIVPENSSSEVDTVTGTPIIHVGD